MELVTGSVVMSKAGRDKGRLMVVVAKGNADVFLCDGGERPLERPKRKNIKHIAPTCYRLEEEDMRTNRKLISALARPGAKSETEA